jgi:hypothetical protein
VLILVYPLYIALCIASPGCTAPPRPSWAADGRPGAPPPRPWLFAASFVQLAVSALVGIVMLGVILSAGRRGFDQIWQ